MYHVNKETGETGQCKASKGKCPFGGPETHFTTAEAARAAYEAQQGGAFQRPKTFQEKFPFTASALPEDESVELRSNGKRADGEFPKLFFKREGNTTRVYGARRELIAYFEGRGIDAPEGHLVPNASYVREQVPLVAPGESKAKPVKVTRQRAQRPKVIPVPKTKAEFDAAILAIVPEPKDSKVAKLPPINDDQGYMGGRRFAGALSSKANEDGTYKHISQSEASAGIRKLVAEAKKAGELPKWIDVSVRKNSGAWVSSINVEIGFKPEGARSSEAFPKDWVEDESSPYRRNRREAAARIHSYVELLARQYESSDINSMVDYFNSSNAGRVTWKY